MMAGRKKVRCFIGILFPRQAIDEIVRVQEALREGDLFVGKFTQEENLHMTLKFLGGIDEEKVREVAKKLEGVKFREFFCTLGGVGVFSKDFVRIIWMGILGDGIFQLQKDVDGVLSDGFEPERRFMGHLTLARVKKVNNKEKLFKFLEGMKISELKFLVDRFYLIKSELSSDEPHYELLGEFAGE